MSNIFGRALASMCARGILGWLPDKQYLQLYYFGLFGKWIDFDNPKTFNEKLQWLKLYNRKKIYTTMVDKEAAKKYVSDIIGEKYIIPTIGVWEKFEDIDFSKLPDQFVLKTTHDSGSVCICRNKSSFDIEKARKKINTSLKHDFYRVGREWPYKNVKHKIIAEKLMEDDNLAELRDYKFFCFSGEPIYCQVISDRSTNETIDFFDMEWNHMNFTGLEKPYHPFSKTEICKPSQFSLMKKFAQKLSRNIPFVRVDFYEINQKLYFGEMTFYPASGFGMFSVDSINIELGNKIIIEGIQN